MTYNGLPVYIGSIDENDTETGVEFISLVDEPAIMVDWITMSANKQKLYAADQEKRILLGPVMIADQMIYRIDPKRGEYYVMFTKEKIEQILLKFNSWMQQDKQRSIGINYMHEENSKVSSAVILEQWIIEDKEKDKSNKYGFDLPVGTWMAKVYIDDQKFWDEEIKTGNVKGFSIEGYLNMEMKKMEAAMQKHKFDLVKTVTGDDVFLDGAVAVDTKVYSDQISYMIIDGKSCEVRNPSWDNIVELEDGTILTLANGVIVVVEQKSAVAQQKIKTKMMTINTTDGLIITTTAETLAEGAEVTVDDGNGNQVPAPDGDYVLENGATITVKDGKVTAIVDAVAEKKEEAPVEQAEQSMSALIEPVMNALNAINSRIEALEKASAEQTAMKEITKSISELSDKFSKMTGPSLTTMSKEKEEPVMLSVYDKLAALKTNKK